MKGAKTLKKNPGRVKEVNAELKDMDLNVIDQYAVLGNFDFLTIVERMRKPRSPKQLLKFLSRGSIKTATYKAIPIDEFIESLK